MNEETTNKRGCIGTLWRISAGVLIGLLFAIGIGLFFEARAETAVNMFSGFELAAKIGLLRGIGTEEMAGSAPFIGTDPADPEVYYSFIAAPQWWVTSGQEFSSHLNDDHLAMVRDNGEIQDLPLLIIGSDVLGTTGNAAMDGLQSARYEKLQMLASQSSQGQFIIAEGSTHNVLTDRPDVVMAAIASVVEE